MSVVAMADCCFSNAKNYRLGEADSPRQRGVREISVCRTEHGDGLPSLIQSMTILSGDRCQDSGCAEQF